ncbi:hypothetical protein BASA81_006845 [Batrachochytrium salamandrivorans]|nr:hypothetical protein BASA81_006845 [Batrachochytrium salamandrivorans]
MSQSAVEEEEDEDSKREPKSTEYDIQLTLSLVKKLQCMGENVLIDDFLVNHENDDEWDAERLLDVLISMQVAGIEKHRGISNRNSRAFTYRTGYADPGTDVANLAEDIKREQRLLLEQQERCKRVKQELDLRPTSNLQIYDFLLRHVVPHRDQHDLADDVQRFLHEHKTEAN